GRSQVIELVDRRAECAFAREGSDVNFAEHRVVPRPAFPVRASPFIPVIDDFARPVHVVRLEVRGRIRNFDVPVDLETITGTRFDMPDVEHEPLAVLRHGNLALEDEVHSTCGRRPQVKRDTVARQQRAKPRRADPFVGHGLALLSEMTGTSPTISAKSRPAHASPPHARTDRGCALQCPPSSSVAEFDCPFAVSITHCQRATAGHSGPVMSTTSSAPLSTTNSGSPPSVTAPST